LLLQWDTFYENHLTGNGVTLQKETKENWRTRL